MERCQYCPDECPRKNESISNPCILGVGPYDAKLMIICENPGINEDEDDIPFGGRSGKLLDSILEECGISKNEVYITNAVKCFTTRVDYKPTKKEIKYCSAYLEEEITNINPNVILTLGATPLFAVLGKDKITKLKNNIFISDKYGIKVIPTYHPAYILRNPNEYNELKKGVELAIAEIESKNKCTKTAIPNKTIIVNEDNFDAVINKILELDEYAFDLETTSLNPLVAKIICISISCKEGIGIIIPFDLINNNPSYMESIKKLFASTALKIGQNIKYDIEVLLCNRISVKGPFFDTMIAHHLLDENSKHGLDDLVLRYLDLGDYWTIIEKDKERVSKELKISKDEVTYDLLNREMLYKYASKDADATFRLYNIFKEKLEKEDLLDFFYNHAMPYMPNIIEMEIRGVKVDREKLKELIDSYHIKLAEIKDTLYKDKDVIGYEALRKQREYKKLADKYEKSKILKSRYPNGVIEYIDSNLKDESWKFNFSSPKQLIELFFKYMKLTPVKLSEKGSESTDSEVLKILANANVTVAKLLMEYRKISKFLSTYLESVYKKSELDGRIHTTYLQTATVSGRLASINPNQQTLPRDAIDFKDCFVSDPGFLFVKSDLGQAEFRCWAAYSNDTDMIRDIELSDMKLGLDIHIRTASEVFNILPENVTDEQRTAAKNCVFGLMYGRGAKAISKQYGISVEEAELVREKFFERYPVASAWIEELQNEALNIGIVRSWFGRVRRVPKVFSNDDNEKLEALRQAVNSPIQAQASDMNNAFMIRVLKAARTYGIKCYPAMTTHDDNTYQVEENKVNEFIQIINNVVATAFPDWKCKMKVAIKIGNRLGSCKKLE